MGVSSNKYESVCQSYSAAVLTRVLASGVARALTAVCEKAPRAQVRALAPRLWPPVAALLDGGGPAHGVLARLAACQQRDSGSLNPRSPPLTRLACALHVRTYSRARSLRL